MHDAAPLPRMQYTGARKGATPVLAGFGLEVAGRRFRADFTFHMCGSIQRSNLVEFGRIYPNHERDRHRTVGRIEKVGTAGPRWISLAHKRCIKVAVENFYGRINPDRPG